MAVLSPSFLVVAGIFMTAVAQVLLTKFGLGHVAALSAAKLARSLVTSSLSSTNATRS